jgi:uncharacterized repeat protein (TIGR01451 family)
MSRKDPGFRLSSGRPPLWALSLVAALLVAAPGFSHASAGGEAVLNDSAVLPGTAAPLQQAEQRLTVISDQLPLTFEPNLGQTGAEVRYLSRGPGYNLFLTPSEIVLSLSRPVESSRTGKGRAGRRQMMSEVRRSTVRLKIVGAAPDPLITGREALPGTTNYLTGDRSSWRTGVPHYRKVHYREIYPGVDLVFYGSQGQLEFDFRVAPGADLKSVGLQVEGADGISLDERGNLVLALNGGDVMLRAPLVYQEVDGRRVQLPGAYSVHEDNRVGFRVASYDRDKELVVDPVITYASYLGGTDSSGGVVWGEAATSVALDPGGNIIVVGYSDAVDFPTMNAFQPSNEGFSDAFVLKLDPPGSNIVFLTYLGGATGDDFAYRTVVDGNSNILLTGGTDSSDFPTLMAAQPTYGGAGSGFYGDAFAAKLDSTGTTLVYSTYLGGDEDEEGWGVDVDSSGYGYFAGWSDSFTIKFPVTPGAFDTTMDDVGEGFIAKLTPAGAMSYATFLGGSNDDWINDIAVDGSGGMFITGGTMSADFPTANPFDPFYGGFGSRDGFVANLNASGTTLAYSSYIGGEDVDDAEAIDLDSTGNAYVTGRSASLFDSSFTGLVNCTGGQSINTSSSPFVIKVNPAGARSYLRFADEGSQSWGNDVAVDSLGRAHVAGGTFAGGGKAYYVLVSADCNSIVDSLSFGGTWNGTLDFQEAWGIALDSSGDPLLVGYTDSADFPTTSNAVKPFSEGPTDGFLVKLGPDTGPSADLAVTKTDDVDPIELGSGGVTYTLTVTNNGPDAATGVVLIDTLPPEVSFDSAGGPGCTENPVNTATCTVGNLASGASTTRTLLVSTISAGLATNTASVAGSESDPVPGNNSTTEETTITANWADLTVTKTDSPDPVSVGGTLTYTVTVVNNGPLAATAVTLTDTLPGTVTYVSNSQPAYCSESGGTVTCNIGPMSSGGNFSVDIVVTAPGTPGNINNAASVTGAETDPNPSDNLVFQSTTVTAPSADLSVTKTDSPDPVLQGDDVTYTVTVANAGPLAATGVTLTDTLSSDLTFVSTTPSQGTCNPPVGQTVTCDLGTISSSGSATVTVVATASGSTGTVSNTATETTTVNEPLADLSVTKTGSADPVPVNTNLTYTLTVANAGPNDATGVVLTDNLPAGVNLVSTSGCAEDPNGAPTCSLGTIASGANASVDIVVTPTSVGTIINTAMVSGIETDPDPSNNSGTETTTVEPPDISVSPTSHDFGNVLVGDSSDVEITVSNNSVIAELNVSSMSLTNTTDFALDVASGSSPCGTTAPVIAPSASCTVTATFMPQSATAFTVTVFTADLSITSDDPDEPTLDVALSGGGVADTDGDGVDDLTDDSPSDNTVATATGTGKITLDVSGVPGATLSGVTTLLDTDPSLNPANKPGDFTFPDGLVSFTVNGVSPGQTVDVVATFPSGLPAGFKHFKADSTTGFFEYPDVSAAGDTLTITLIEGGLGDSDANTNSVTDPSGVGTPVPSGGGGGGGGCFIATAAYGSYQAPYVRLLREFRDEYLLTNPPGRRFVDAYYRYSPPAAAWLDAHGAAKPVVRVRSSRPAWRPSLPPGSC